MAAWRATDRDRDPLSDQRPLASKLQIVVRENLRRICVTMPGTHYGMEFADANGRLGLLSGFGPNDKSAPITTREFAILAEGAAKRKALELGWCAQGGWSSRGRK